jgi:hypothetical protein
MNLSTSVLGTHVVKQLQAKHGEAVLQVGSDRLTRRDLAAVSCYNFQAARNLTAILGVVGAKSLKDVYENHPPTDLALPHMGSISLAVLGAAFEVAGIGGSDPLENYVKKHLKRNGSVRESMVTFDTLKARELTERREEKKEARRRRRLPSAQAQAADTGR